jgi:hypothetical protein
MDVMDALKSRPFKDILPAAAGGPAVSLQAEVRLSMVRNSAPFAPRKGRKEVTAGLKNIYTAELRVLK